MKRALAWLVALCLLLGGMNCAVAEGFHYAHDPRENPSAMADIVEDASAVYGFRPSAEGSLKQYADMDWTDPEIVEAGRQDRLAYHESIEEMYKLLVDMKAEGATTEEIARAVSAKRNEIRLASYADDPEGLEMVKARNLEEYGHEEGPLPDDLFEKYGSWQKVLEKSFSTNSGMDACLGLYDDYYELYIAAGQIPADGPAVYTHDRRVTLIDGACVDTPVNGMEDAAEVVASVLDQLGGDARTELEPWRTLTDAYGNRYYVFQQMYDNTTVLGGAVKVITDSEGAMIGLTSSIVSDLPEAEGGASVSAEQAEQIVLDQAARTRQQTLQVVDGLTKEMILPITLEIDVEADDDDGSRYVWVVYTDNPGSQGSSADLPYLAHYVTLSGEYLYSLPTIMPGDEAGESGFDAGYVFEFMEPADYTGYVDLSTGGEMEITVTVMRDKRTGMYYLGNLERRIVVADCYDFLYDGGRVVLESSPDNLAWDQVGLLSLYNYCRAYDYYKEIGWIGGDGEQTPMLILNNFCDANRNPVNNAAYAGKYLGWQIFLASQCNDFSQSLDVLGHEFTHCVTGSVMTYNAYMNDYGAINEAMSDIQGKTLEMLAYGAENVSWEMGDRAKEQIRSMSEPHRYQQPAFSWDLFYMPNVKTPTELNDEGGVHTNSSLLNTVAWMLYEKGGMTLEEGRAFWFTVDCAMVPGTDYPQLSELLPWALRATGLEQYDAELQRALDATRLGQNAMPESFDQDHALLSLNLPDTEVFNDEQWVMQVVSVNVDKLIQSVRGIIGRLVLGDTSVLPPSFRGTLSEDAATDMEEEDKGFFETLMETLLEVLAAEEGETSEAAEPEPDASEALKAEMMEWVREHFEDVFYFTTTNAGQDGHSMRVVSIPGYTVPMLFHGIWNDETSDLDDVYLLAYVGGQWIDVIGLINDAVSLNKADEATQEAMIDGLVENTNGFLDGIGGIHSLDDVLKMLFYRVEGGEVNALPADGLDTIQPQTSVLLDGMLAEAADTVQPRLSRPKLDEEQKAA